MERLRVSHSYNEESEAVVYKGNCHDFIKTIPDRSVKLVVTSPPYNIGKEYEKRDSLESYCEGQGAIIEESLRILSDDGSICWQVGNYVHNSEILPLDIVLYPIFRKYGLKLRNRIIWHFGHGLHASKRFSGRYESILWFTKGDSYTFNLDAVRVPQKYPGKKHFKGPRTGQLSGNPLGKNPGDIWEIPNVKSNHVEKTIHPCQFPVALIERLILSMTYENETVFDPFLGVGTTIVAAVRNGRRGMGAELLDKYYDIALERIQAALKGTLRTRPMFKPIYDPLNPRENLDYEKYAENELFPELSNSL